MTLFSPTVFPDVPKSHEREHLSVSKRSREITESWTREDRWTRVRDVEVATSVDGGARTGWDCVHLSGGLKNQGQILF